MKMCIPAEVRENAHFFVDPYNHYNVTPFLKMAISALP